MTDELDLYQPSLDLGTIQRQTTDDWFDAFANIVKLAEYVADTEFVPDTMRRRPAAVAAAILTGREMGLAPMVALRMLHIIKGKVGQSAELMRALVLRAGHEIRDTEVTDNRVILEGRRRGETDWARATFTAEDARKARIDLGGYPKDKLYARATTRLCRRKFADIIAGLPTVDELEDGYYTDTTAASLPTNGAAVQRTRKPRPPKAANTQPKPTPATEPDTEIAELLNEDHPHGPKQTCTEYEDRKAELEHYADTGLITQAQADAAIEEISQPEAGPDGYWAVEPTTPPTPDDLALEPPEPALITPAQLKKLSILLREQGFDTQEARHAFVATAINRNIDTAKNLSKAEASHVIDVLENAQEMIP